MRRWALSRSRPSTIGGGSAERRPRLAHRPDPGVPLGAPTRDSPPPPQPGLTYPRLSAQNPLWPETATREIYTAQAWTV